MTGTEQARSGHFCICGYGAKAPLRLASQPHFWGGAARKFGKRHTRVWGRSAKQAEDCEAIPKKLGDGRWSLLQSDGSRLFHWPQTALCCCLKTKLAEIAWKCVQTGSPGWVQGMKYPGAELEAAEASNVPPSSSNFCLCIFSISVPYHGVFCAPSAMRVPVLTGSQAARYFFISSM